MNQSPWGQLGYASTRGGFGIHAEEGLDPRERDLLVGGAHPDRTSFGQEVPMVASAEQAALFYRSLSYRFEDEVGGCYWHSAPAGPDESGRTGNCFVHALLDRTEAEGEDEDAGGGFRPIRAWRSPTMLAPFGAHQVQTATLPTLPPSASSVTGRREVVEFIVDFTADRLSPLRILLRHLARPRSKPVILAVADPDEAALWIAAVSYLMAPAQARQFSFSLWEMPQLLTPSRLPRVELICVEGSAITQQVTELGLPIIGSEGGADGGDGEAASDDDLGRLWASLAVEQLFNLPEHEIVTLLEEIDQVSARVALDPAQRVWPLAMVMALHHQSQEVPATDTDGQVGAVPDDLVAQRRAELRDEQRGVVAQALARVTPSTIDRADDLWAITAQLVTERERQLPLDELWSSLAQSAPGPLQKMLHEAYVERAVQDPAWFSDPRHREATDLEARPGDWSASWLREAVDALPAHDDEVDALLERTRLVDFLMSQGWEAPPREWVGELPIADTSSDTSEFAPQPEGAEPPAEVDAKDPDDESRPPLSGIWEIFERGRTGSARSYAQGLDISDSTVKLFLGPVVEEALNHPVRGVRTSLGTVVPMSLLERLLPLHEVVETDYPDLDGAQGALWLEALSQYVKRDDIARAQLLEILINSNQRVKEILQESVPTVLDELRQYPDQVDADKAIRLLDIYKSHVPPRIALRALATADYASLRHLCDRITSFSEAWMRTEGLTQELRLLQDLPPLVLWPEREVQREGGKWCSVDVRELHEWLVRDTDNGRALLGDGWRPFAHLLMALRTGDQRGPELISLVEPDPARRTEASRADVTTTDLIVSSVRGQAKLEDRLLYNAWREREVGRTLPRRVSLGRSARRETGHSPVQQAAAMMWRSYGPDDQFQLRSALLSTLDKDRGPLPFEVKDEVESWLATLEGDRARPKGAIFGRRRQQ